MRGHFKGKRFACLFLLMVSIFGFSTIQAKEFPTKPVTLIIPVGAGGSHDLSYWNDPTDRSPGGAHDVFRIRHL